jgi:hypothetical protein
MAYDSSFNQNSVLQSLTAATPEKLCELMRSIKMPTQIIGFASNPGEFVCYFRCLQKVTVKDSKAKTGELLDR